jgi:6-pyruvoyltetrahydropterin/6-carboxytetrahydropterin synthase
MIMRKHITIKNYGHERGLSCAFRQWKAKSHCRFNHSYAIAVKFIFECEELDETNWGVDFGNMHSLKNWLEDTFDHKTLISEDDPHLDFFKQGHELGVLDLIIVPGVGCEKFSEMIFEKTILWLAEESYAPRVKIKRVEVWEHGSNGAGFERDYE